MFNPRWKLIFQEALDPVKNEIAMCFQGLKVKKVPTVIHDSEV